MTRSAEYLQQLLKEVDARKKDIDALLPLRREDEDRLWKKLRLEWNYNSNHIEGNTLTYQETELIVIFDREPNGSHTVREIEEMKAHDVVVALIRDWSIDEQRELSEADIRDLNRILLVRPFWKEALTPDGQPTRRLIEIGDYKKHPNSVRLANGEMFHYVSPEETPRKMAELVEWYRTTSKEQHPAVVAARLHYDVVRIHPFDDGNGRVSRLLMNYHLLRNGFPPVIIKSTDKNNYLAALQRADVGDFDAFAAYIAQQLLWSLDLTARAAKGESVEEVGDWEKEVAIIEKVWRQEEKPLPKSHDIFIERHNDSFWPLLWALDHKIAIIDAFYAQSNRWVEVKIGGSSTRMSFDELNEYIYQLDTNSVEGIESITANCNWEKFLPNLGISNNLFARIEIRFSLYQYHIFFSPGNNSVVEKKYTLPLMPFEKEGIMETIGKNLVEKIKKAKP